MKDNSILKIGIIVTVGTLVGIIAFLYTGNNLLKLCLYEASMIGLLDGGLALVNKVFEKSLEKMTEEFGE